MNAQEAQQKILQIIASLQEANPTEGIADARIAEQIALSIQEIRDHLDLMEEADYVTLSKTFGGYRSAWLTPKGRMLLHEPGYRQAPPSQVINILTVIDSRIENLAQTGNNAIVEQSADSELNEQILGLVEHMVEVVHSSSDIAPSVKQDYALEAEGLKSEIKKSRLNLTRIREMLAFLGDVEGTLGLAARLAPYVIALAPYIERLIQR